MFLIKIIISIITICIKVRIKHVSYSNIIIPVVAKVVQNCDTQVVKNCGKTVVDALGNIIFKLRKEGHPKDDDVFEL